MERERPELSVEGMGDREIRVQGGGGEGGQGGNNMMGGMDPRNEGCFVKPYSSRCLMIGGLFLGCYQLEGAWWANNFGLNLRVGFRMGLELWGREERCKMWMAQPRVLQGVCQGQRELELVWCCLVLVAFHGSL